MMSSLQRFVDKTSSCSAGGGVNLDHLFKEVLVRCLHLFKEVLVSVFREALLIFPLH